MMTKKQIERFKQQLKVSKKEKDVESAWRSLFSDYYNITVTSPYSVDGYLELDSKELTSTRILLEFKYGLDFNESYDRAKVVAQMIYYTL